MPEQHKYHHSVSSVMICAVGIGLSAPLGVKLLIYAREHVHITDLLPGQKVFVSLVLLM